MRGGEDDLGVEGHEDHDGKQNEDRDERPAIQFVLEEEINGRERNKIKCRPVGGGCEGEGKAKDEQRFGAGLKLEAEKCGGGEQGEKNKLRTEEFGLAAVVKHHGKGGEDACGVEG